MPIHDFLPAEDDRPVIDPSELRVDWLGADSAVIALTPGAFRLAAETLGATPERCRAAGCLERFHARGIPFLLAYFGAPAAAMLLEVLAASGARRVLVLGEAGSISLEARIGDVVLPEWAIREEGTSYHYLPPERTPRSDPEMTEALESSLGRSGVKTLRGGVWTTDAPFRETVGKVRRYSSLGALAVEMECSALMAVAEFRGVRLAAGLAITDELFEGVWRPRFSAPEVDRARTALAKAAVEALLP